MRSVVETVKEMKNVKRAMTDDESVTWIDQNMRITTSSPYLDLNYFS